MRLLKVEGKESSFADTVDLRSLLIVYQVLLLRLFVPFRVGLRALPLGKVNLPHRFD